MKALQQEHLSQEVEDDSMKEIPDNIDFNPENKKEIPDNIDSNQGHVGGRDETDRQSNATPQEILQANAAHAQKSEDSRPLSPLDEANGNAASQSEDSRPLSPLNIIAGPSSEDSRPLSPLKPAIPAKPNLGILAARRLSQAGNQQALSNDQNTFLPTGNHETVLPNKEEKPLLIPVFDPDTPSLPMSTPLSSMEVLSHRY